MLQGTLLNPAHVLGHAARQRVMCEHQVSSATTRSAHVGSCTIPKVLASQPCSTANKGKGKGKGTLTSCALECHARVHRSRTPTSHTSTPTKTVTNIQCHAPTKNTSAQRTIALSIHLYTSTHTAHASCHSEDLAKEGFPDQRRKFQFQPSSAPAPSPREPFITKDHPCFQV